MKNLILSFLIIVLFSSPCYSLENLSYNVWLFFEESPDTECMIVSPVERAIIDFTETSFCLERLDFNPSFACGRLSIKGNAFISDARISVDDAIISDCGRWEMVFYNGNSIIDLFVYGLGTLARIRPENGDVLETAPFIFVGIIKVF